MALDIFIDFGAGGAPVGAGSSGPVQGESTDAAYPNTIPVTAFTLGVQNPTTIGSASAGAGAGKTQFQALKFTKSADKASTGLFTACAVGQHFKSVKLYVRKPSTKGAYLVYQFEMVFITQIQAQNGDSAILEEVQAVYGAMQLSYTQTLPTGQVASQPLTASWSQVTNQPNLTVPGN